MGIVHRATDRLTGETVALKQVFLSSQQQALSNHSALKIHRALRLALAREFQMLASMRHPHIISVLDYGFGGFISMTEKTAGSILKRDVVEIAGEGTIGANGITDESFSHSEPLPQVTLQKNRKTKNFVMLY